MASLLEDGPPVLPAVRTSSTSSWFSSSLGTVIDSATVPNTAPSKFGTMPSAPSRGNSNRGLVGLGFFTGRTGDGDGMLGDAIHTAQAGLDNELKDLQGLRKEDESWSVSLAEQRENGRMRPRGKRILTVYVSTPVSSLTLTRTYQSILDLDARVRTQLRHYPLPPLLLPPSPATTAKKRSNVLATLSRTLSPRRSPVSSPSSSPRKDETFSSSPTNSGLDLHALGSHLSKLSSDVLVRESPAWRSFFAVRADDLESSRVERRIKRARSDITSRHPFSSSAPASTAPMNTIAAETERDIRQEPSNEMSDESAASGSSTDQVVDVSNGSHEVHSFFDLTRASKIILEQEGDDGEIDDKEHKMELSSSMLTDEDQGMRRDVSDYTMASSVSGASANESAEGGVIELPSRPRTADPENEKHRLLGIAGVRNSRTIEIPKIHGEEVGTEKRKKKEGELGIDSFDILRVLGKGCAGKVLLVRKKTTGSLYALKAIHKHHVLAHRELDHTRTEQAVLKRCSRDQSNPFVVRLHYSFHDKDTLYLALDFHPGGDLATQLARWGRLGRDRTRFYCAEIVEGVEGLHRAGVIYRDLKPENILISEAGHVVLTDFGLSKDFGHAVIPPSSSESLQVGGTDGGPPSPRPHWLPTGPSRSISTPPSGWLSSRRETTTTFCGTAEYLAPDTFSFFVLLGEPYSYEVDSWSLGTMLYEMLAGVTPFWSEDHSTMYRKVLHDELTFDEDARVFDDDTKSILRGLLQRNPLLRMSDSRIKKHPYFSMIEWPHVYHKRYVPPFIPTLNPLDPADTSQFDDTYTSQIPHLSNENAIEATSSDRDPPEGEPQAAYDESGHDVFDGYSYFGGRDVDSIVGLDDDEFAADTELEAEGVDAVEAYTQQGDTSMGSGGTFSTLASDSTPATSVATATPAKTRPRLRSTGLNSLAEEVPVNVDGAGMLVEDGGKEMEKGDKSQFDGDDDEVSDSEWDVIDAVVGGEARNGGKGHRSTGTTLWARGVKDRYRLLVSSTPRVPSPLRSTIPKSPSGRAWNRKESTASTPSSSIGPISPPATPEPSRRPLRRLASARSSNSSKVALKSRASHRSLRDKSTTQAPTARTNRLNESDPSLSDGAPRKASQTIKRLASAFLSPKS